MQSNRSGKKTGWLQFTVVSIGLLVFVLLLIADKTNLNDDSSKNMVSGESGSGENSGSGNSLEKWIALVPPENPDSLITQLLSSLEQSNDGAKRQEILQQIVTAYRETGRLDLAAIYAGNLAEEQPSVKNYVVAGALFRNANFMPTLQMDSVLFRKFSDESIRMLENALAIDSQSEDAQIELGLALVESRVPGSGMQGIMKLREVADKNPENIEALFHLGRFSMDTGQFDKAENRFRQILDLEPGNVSAKYFLALSLSELGKSAESKKLMSEVASQQEDSELARMAEESLRLH